MDVDIFGAMLGATELLFQPKILFYIALGTFFGTLLAVVPGIGALMGLALLLPFTFSMDATTAIAFLLGALAVMSTADSIPAVLFGVPGTPSSMVTVLDGYPMAKKGQAGRALGAAFSSSIVGGILGALVLLLIIPVVVPALMAINTPELLAFCVLGLSMVAVLSGGSMMKGLAAASLGVLLAMIGEDGQTATQRWTFGSIYLWDGLNILIIVLGVYALPELADLAIQRKSIAKGSSAGAQMRGAGEGVKDTFRNFGLVSKSSGMSSILGTLPALGPTIIPWLVYSYATLTAKGKKEFGQGDVRGVIASESANNATVGGSLLPTVALGIPGSAPMALLLGAMMLQGIAPGPDMLTKNLDFTYMMVWVIVIANIFGGLMAFGLSVQLSRIVFVKAQILVPVIASVVFLGAVQASRQWEDIGFLLALGLLGWLMKHAGWSRSPFVLAFVLAPLVEQYFHISMNIHGWAWTGRPIVIAVLAVAAIFTALIAGKRLLAFYKVSRVPGRWVFAPRFGLELVLAALALAASLYAYLSAERWPFEAAITPQIAAGLGVVTAGACLLFTLGRRDYAPGTAPERGESMHYDVQSELGDFDALTILTRGLRFAALLLVFFGLAWSFGLLPALPLFLLLAMLVERVRLVVAVPVTVGVWALMFLIFDYVLSLPWPVARWSLSSLLG